jgi:hypothetical protein
VSPPKKFNRVYRTSKAQLENKSWTQDITVREKKSFFVSRTFAAECGRNRVQMSCEATKRNRGALKADDCGCWSARSGAKFDGPSGAHIRPVSAYTVLAALAEASRDSFLNSVHLSSRASVSVNMRKNKNSRCADRERERLQIDGIARAACELVSSAKEVPRGPAACTVGAAPAALADAHSG